MSIHPSLNISEKDKKHRSVMKRAERLKIMLDKGQWKEGDNVYGLPKVKSLKIKIKKEKVEKAATAAAEGAVAAPAPEAKTTQTNAAPARGSQGKK